MNALESTQLSSLHEMLAQRQHALEAQVAPQTEPGDLPVSEVETAPADKATVRLLNDMALEAAEHIASSLTDVRHALSKFADASYGQCESCGEPIGYSRLQARPEARLCIVCQTRQEQR